MGRGGGEEGVRSYQVVKGNGWEKGENWILAAVYA
jgi:hypothetical protein